MESKIGSLVASLLFLFLSTILAHGQQDCGSARDDGPGGYSSSTSSDQCGAGARHFLPASTFPTVTSRPSTEIGPSGAEESYLTTRLTDEAETTWKNFKESIDPVLSPLSVFLVHEGVRS